MKRSQLFLLTLFCVMGSIIFSGKQTPENEEHNNASVPVPALKPANLHASGAKLGELRLQMSTPDKAGSYSRLSLEQFLAKDTSSPSLDDRSPELTPRNQTPANNVTQPSRIEKDEPAPIHSPPSLHLSDLQIDAGQAASLPYLPDINENRLLDRVFDMAEASPLQPDSRGCGTLNHNLKSAPKHSKVRSVGMERQLTNCASIGVEYVYKDGCYKKAVAPLNALELPGDNGVNLRMNMKF